MNFQRQKIQDIEDRRSLSAVGNCFRTAIYQQKYVGEETSRLTSMFGRLHAEKPNRMYWVSRQRADVFRLIVSNMTYETGMSGKTRVGRVYLVQVADACRH